MYRNSTILFHQSKWSFSSSVKRIVLSSQQVNENQRTTNRFCRSAPMVWCADRSITMWSYKGEYRMFSHVGNAKMSANENLESNHGEYGEGDDDRHKVA